MGEVREYDTKVDSRRRVTLRGAVFEHYHVTEYEDGRVLLEPRELVPPPSISRRTLEMVDAAMASLERGDAGPPVEPDDLLAKPKK